MEIIFILNTNYQSVPEEVVHVHALGPALLVADLLLVLQVANDPGNQSSFFHIFFCGNAKNSVNSSFSPGLPRQGPHQAAAVRGGVARRERDLKFPEFKKVFYFLIFFK